MMKPGLDEGKTVTLTLTVTPEMFAAFDGKVVHRAYSTVSMVYHMEWASRQLILPYLEDDEEGMGTAVNARHIAPSKEGSTISITATLIQKIDNFIITEVKVRNEHGLIGIGDVKQVILKKEKIHKLLSR